MRKKVQNQTIVNFRMDTDLKKELDSVCKELGMTMSSAFNIFARKMVREQRIPFEVSIETSNEQNKIRYLGELEKQFEDN